MLLRLPEVKGRLNNAPKHRVGLLGCPVQGQESNSMILMGPFQLSLSCDSKAQALGVSGWLGQGSWGSSHGAVPETG